MKRTTLILGSAVLIAAAGVFAYMKMQPDGGTQGVGHKAKIATGDKGGGTSGGVKDGGMTGGGGGIADGGSSGVGGGRTKTMTLASTDGGDGQGSAGHSTGGRSAKKTLAVKGGEGGLGGGH